MHNNICNYSQRGQDEFVVERKPRGLKKFSGLRRLPLKDVADNWFKPHRRVENGE